MGVHHVLTGTFIFLGLLFVGLGLPLALRKVAPNRSYGFRNKKTLSDEKIWYAANRVAGRDFVIAGGAIALTSAGLLVLGEEFLPAGYVWPVDFGVFLVALAVAVIHSVVSVSRL